MTLVKIAVENMEHCDFIALRNMLIRTHMTDLKEVTNNVHYENFRCRKLAGVGVSAEGAAGKGGRISNKYVSLCLSRRVVPSPFRSVLRPRSFFTRARGAESRSTATDRGRTCVFYSFESKRAPLLRGEHAVKDHAGSHEQQQFVDARTFPVESLRERLIIASFFSACSPWIMSPFVLVW